MSTQGQSALIKTFVERLVAEKKFENTDAEILEQITSDLTDRVEDRINAIILEHLPPEQLEAFEALLDQESTDEEIQEFCRAHIPDLENVLAAELLTFRSTYLNS